MEPRNDFAHVSEAESEGRRVLKVADSVYDEDGCIKILKQIKKHSLNLDAISEFIKGNM